MRNIYWILDTGYWLLVTDLVILSLVVIHSHLSVVGWPIVKVLWC